MVEDRRDYVAVESVEIRIVLASGENLQGASVALKRMNGTDSISLRLSED